MKKDSYILLLDEDLKAGQAIADAINKQAPGSKLYEASSTWQAINLIEEYIKPFYRQGEEVRILIDLELPYWEAYVFLHKLYNSPYHLPIKVYLIGDNTQQHEYRPPINQYVIAGLYDKKHLRSNISQILAKSGAPYFICRKENEIALNCISTSVKA